VLIFFIHKIEVVFEIVKKSYIVVKWGVEKEIIM
jgi:hypothetical protein